jgi:hypothetical protein
LFSLTQASTATGRAPPRGRAQRSALYRGEQKYQTQFVVDGIPLTDNRSPSFGPEIEADDVQSLKIYTAGIPSSA